MRLSNERVTAVNFAGKEWECIVGIFSTFPSCPPPHSLSDIAALASDSDLLCDPRLSFPVLSHAICQMKHDPVSREPTHLPQQTL